METLRKTIFRSVLLLIAFVPLALAQGTYTQIDVPGASGTWVSGIDTAGDVVGYYIDSSQVHHGFLLSSGIYTTIDDPSGDETYLYGINDNGKIVGFSDALNGLLYDLQTQTFTAINYPNGLYTVAMAINNVGTIVGIFGTADGNYDGFELNGATYKRVGVPNSTTTALTGLNNLAVAVGTFSRPSVEYYFLFHQGKFRQISVPASHAAPFGINDAGAMVGSFLQKNGFLGGFVYQNKRFHALSFPGSTSTDAYGINKAGEVAGVFYDTNNTAHGFTWTHPADAAKK